MEWVLKLLGSLLSKAIEWFGATLAGPLLRLVGKFFLKVGILSGSIFGYWLAHVLENNPNSALLLSQSYFGRAQKRYLDSKEEAINDLNRAISVLDSARARTPDSEDVQTALANYLDDRMIERFQAQEWDKVISDCNKLIDLHSAHLQNDAFYLNRAHAEFKKGRPEDAIATLEEADNLFDSELVRSRLYWHLFERARDYYQNKAWEKAIPDLEKMIVLAADDKTKLTLFPALASARRLVADFEGACQVLRDALKSFPNTIELKTELFNALDEYWRACLEKRDGKTLESIANEQLQLCDPTDFATLSGIYSKRAWAHLSAGDPDGATADATQSLEYDQDNTVAMTYRGLAKRAMSLDEDALSDFSCAISKSQGTTMEIAVRARAQTLLGMRRYDEAAQDYSRLIDDLKVASKEDYLEIAECCIATGHHREAIERLTPLLQKTAEPADARLFMLRGEANYLMGDYLEAAKDYKAAKNLNPKLSFAHYGCGLSLISQSADPKLSKAEAGQLLREAVEYLRRAVELEPNFVAPCFHLADALSRLGDTEGAAQAIREIRGRQQNLPSTPGGDASSFGLYELWPLLGTTLAPDISEEFEDLAKRTPQDPLAQYGAGRTSLLEGESEEKRGNLDKAQKKNNDARRYFTEAIRLHSDFADAYAWRGLARVRSNDLSGAIEDGKKARALSLESPLVWGVLGYAQTGLKNYPEAIDMLQKAIALDPAYVGAYYYLLRIHIFLKDWQPALKESDQAIEGGIRDPIIYVARAEALLSLRRTDEGVRDCSEALNLDQHFWRAHYVRGLLLAQKKNYEGAISDYNLALQLDPPAPDKALLYLAMSEVSRAQGSLSKSIEFLNQAIEKDPKSVLAYYQRGWAWIQKNALEAASNDFDELIRLDDRSVDSIAYCGRAEVKRLEGKLDEALSDISRAIALQPGNYFAYGVRGRIYIDRGDWESAIENLSKALEEDPPNAQFYFWRGECRRLKQEFDSAIADYSAGITLDSKFAWAYYMRGVSLASKESWENALSDLKMATTLEPTTPQFVGDLGWAHYKIGNWAQALEFAERALELDPKSVRDLSRKAEVLVYLGRPGEAVECYTSVVTIDPKEGLSGRGWARCFASDFEGAINDLTKAVGLAPEDAISRDNLAWAKNRKGDWKGAREDATKAIEIDPTSVFAYDNRALSQFQLGEVVSANEDLLNNLITYLNQSPPFIPKRTPHNLIPWQTVAQDWRSVIERHFGSALPYLGTGMARWMAGEIDEALTNLNAAIKLDSALIGAYVAHALVSLEANQLGDAAADVDKLLEIGDSIWLDQSPIAKLFDEVKQRQGREDMSQIKMPELTPPPPLDQDAQSPAKESLR